jgi:hypothetical protein
MRVPTQAPALARNQRSRLVRRFGSGRADGVFPSQYEGGEEGQAGDEGEEGGESGEGGEGGEEGDASVESE